jgi:hypothetical protein
LWFGHSASTAKAMRKLWAIIRRGFGYLSVLVAILVSGALILSIVLSAISEFMNYRPALIYRPSGGQLSYKILPHLVEVFGSLFLPSSIAESTTKTVTATFYASENLPKPFVDRLKKDGVSAQINKAETMTVRAELVAPGVDVTGDAKQDKPLDREAIPFEWACRFKDRGSYEVTVRFAVLDHQGVVTPVGAVKKRIEVTTPSGITRRWAYIAATVAGVVAFVGGILTIIGFFRKKETGAPAPPAPVIAPVLQPIQPAHHKTRFRS